MLSNYFGNTGFFPIFPKWTGITLQWEKINVHTLFLSLSFLQCTGIISSDYVLPV